jgi:hypothetical protein
MRLKTWLLKIGDRIQTECIGCPPDPHPEDWHCAWRFTLKALPAGHRWPGQDLIRSASKMPVVVPQIYNFPISSIFIRLQPLVSKASRSYPDSN